MRLRDGDVNLVGGILEDSEVQSLSGYPGLLKVPVLKYLFGQENKEVRENEIVFAITPHIIRGQDLNEQNLRPVDIGNGSVVEMRHANPDAPANASAKSSPRAPAPGVGASKPTRAAGNGNPAPSPMAAPSGTPNVAPTTAPAVSPSIPSQMSSQVEVNRVPITSPKPETAENSCPTGATPEHPIGCYLNGSWRVDVGDGRGFQIPPASPGAAISTPGSRGVTGTSAQPDQKAVMTASPIV